MTDGGVQSLLASWAMMAGDAPVSVRIPGGHAGPRAARRRVLSELDGTLSERQLTDVGLIVSELVTNSVRHAGVGADATITVEVRVLGDRLRLSVTDPGGPSLPRRAEPDPGRPGGLGLHVVEQLSSAWGVVRDRAGVTRVWCELALQAPESRLA